MATTNPATGEFKISPTFTNKSFGGSPNYKEKILIFKDRVLGWQLNVAEELRSQIEDKQNKGRPIQEAGFAILSILFSYFEMITQFTEGKVSNGRSGPYFGIGLERVFPGQFQHLDKETLYERLRCGMYHAGLVKKGVLISNDFDRAIEYDNANDNNLVKVNPLKLSMVLKADFEKFIKELEVELLPNTRQNFETIFAVIGKGVYD